jgi:hypothetical protein
VNLGYVLGHLDRALGSTGEAAAARVTQWRRVLTGILTGTLHPGSRTPVADAPPWVTLEVAHGGFATSQFKAAGPLQRHEIEHLRLVDRSTGVTDRAALNALFLSDAGRAELRELLSSGCYRVVVPEEAALLTATWLIDRGEVQRAESLLEAISAIEKNDYRYRALGLKSVRQLGARFTDADRLRNLLHRAPYLG